MKLEKILLSFVAIIVGLVAAGAAFYLYQMTKVVPTPKAQQQVSGAKTSPTPSLDSGNILSLDAPKDEQVFSEKQVTINGKTMPDATVIVTTEDTDQIVKPASNGDFSITQTIPDGTSIMYVTAIFADGSEKKITRTVTYSAENF